MTLGNLSRTLSICIDIYGVQVSSSRVILVHPSVLGALAAKLVGHFFSAEAIANVFLLVGHGVFFSDLWPERQGPSAST